MGIGTNRLVVRERISLPSVAKQEWGDWLNSFARNIAAGPRNGRDRRFIVLDNMVVETKEITVHMFDMGDVEDPDLYAAEPLWKWQNSEQGQWVMEHALETPAWYRVMDPMQYGYRYSVRATFDTKTLTEYYLRFGNNPFKMS